MSPLATRLCLDARLLAALVAALLAAGLALGIALASRNGGGTSGLVDGYCVFRQGGGLYCSILLCGAPPVSALRLGGVDLPLGGVYAGSVLRLDAQIAGFNVSGARPAYVRIRAWNRDGPQSEALVTALVSGNPLPASNASLVSRVSGHTPLSARLPGGSAYVVASTGGLCSPVVEAYQGVMLEARWVLRLEAPESGNPQSVAVITPAGADGVRLSCVGGGSVPAGLEVYRAGSVEVELLGPQGPVTASLPAATVPTGVLVFHPPLGLKCGGGGAAGG